MEALTVIALLPLTEEGVAETLVPYEVVNPYSKVTVVVEPFAFTEPFKVADAVVTFVAGLVTTIGAVAGVEVVPLVAGPLAVRMFAPLRATKLKL